MRKSKKIIASAFACMLAARMFVQPVFAEDIPITTITAADGEDVRYSSSAFDPSASGSITIYKYEDNEGTMMDGDGQYHSKNDLDTAMNLSDGEKLRPMSGIQFTASKIADITGQNGTDAEGNRITEVSYTNLDPDFIRLASNYGVTIITGTSTMDGNTVTTCTSKEMERVIKAVNATTKPIVGSVEDPGETALITYGKNHAAFVFDDTDENGKTKAEDLPLGLYLITETGYAPSEKAVLESEQRKEDVTGDTTQNHQDVENPASPYLVSLPMTNVSALDGNDAGTVWQYDVTTYPKNQTTSVTKKIISPDPEDDLLLEDYEDYDMGDTVKQIIYADAPANLNLDYADLGYDSLSALEADIAAGNASERQLMDARPYTTFAITDEMEEGLKFDGVTRVFITPYVTDPKTEMDFENYTTTETGEKEELVANQDYVLIGTPVTGDEVSDNGAFEAPADNKSSDTQFTVQLTDKGIAKLNAHTDRMRSQVVVYFDSEVTPLARIGTDYKNTNQATLTWKHSNTSTHTKKSNETRIFTYELDITKAMSNMGDNEDSFDPSECVFNVRQNLLNGHGYGGKVDMFSKGHTADSVKNMERTLSESNNLLSGDDPDTQWDDTAYIRFIREEAGVYHVFCPKTDKEEDAVTEISPEKSGKLQLKGLDSEDYTITERKTQDGLSLLKEPVEVSLRAKTQTDAEGAQTGGGNGLTVEEIAESKGTEGANTLASKHINGALESAEAKPENGEKMTALTIGGTYNDEESYEGAAARGKNDGAASLTIFNEKAVTLFTGGTGRLMFLAAAAIISIFLGFVYAYDKKRSRS